LTKLSFRTSLKESQCDAEEEEPQFHLPEPIKSGLLPICRMPWGTRWARAAWRPARQWRD